MSYKMTELVRDCTTAPDGHELTPSEKLVAVLLATYFNEEEGYAFPSLTTLANQAALSRSQVIRVLASLAKHGCIEKERQPAAYGDNYVSNHYTFPAAFLGSPGSRVRLARATVFRDKKGSSADATTRQPFDREQVVAPVLLRSSTENTPVVAPAPLRSSARATSGSSAHATLNGTSETEPFSKKKRESSSEPDAAFFFSQEQEAELMQAHGLTEKGAHYIATMIRMGWAESPEEAIAKYKADSQRYGELIEMVLEPEKVWDINEAAHA